MREGDEENDSLIGSRRDMRRQEQKVVLQPRPNVGTKSVSWVVASFLLIADIIGVGVLALPTAFQQLGWVLAVLSFIYSFAVNQYAGYIVGEARALYSASGEEANSYMALSHRCFGPRSAKWIGGAVYFFLMLVNGNYMIVMKNCLMLTFYTTQLCSPVWLLICVCMLLPITQFRFLGELKVLPVANFLVIVLAVMLALINLAMSNGRPASLSTTGGNGTELIASSLTFSSFFAAQALIALSFSGVMIFCEIIGEMRNPKEFNRSLFLLSGPMVFGLYFITGAVGYAYVGSVPFDLIIQILPKGPLLQATCVLLILHLNVAFSVNHTVVSAALHKVLKSDTAYEINGWAARRDHLLISVALLMFVYLLTNLIPFFTQMTSLIGSLLTPFLGFQLPLVLILKAREDFEIQTSTGEKVWMFLLFVYSMLVFTLGTYWTIDAIVKGLQLKPPFSC